MDPGRFDTRLRSTTNQEKGTFWCSSKSTTKLQKRRDPPNQLHKSRSKSRIRDPRALPWEDQTTESFSITPSNAVGQDPDGRSDVPKTRQHPLYLMAEHISMPNLTSPPAPRATPDSQAAPPDPAVPTERQHHHVRVGYEIESPIVPYLPRRPTGTATMLTAPLGHASRDARHEAKSYIYEPGHLKDTNFLYMKEPVRERNIQSTANRAIIDNQTIHWRVEASPESRVNVTGAWPPQWPPQRANEASPPKTGRIGREHALDQSLFRSATIPTAQYRERPRAIKHWDSSLGKSMEERQAAVDAAKPKPTLASTGRKDSFHVERHLEQEQGAIEAKRLHNEREVMLATTGVAEVAEGKDGSVAGDILAAICEVDAKCSSQTEEYKTLNRKRCDLEHHVLSGLMKIEAVPRSQVKERQLRLATINAEMDRQVWAMLEGQRQKTALLQNLIAWSAKVDFGEGDEASQYLSRLSAGDSRFTLSYDAVMNFLNHCASEVTLEDVSSVEVHQQGSPLHKPGDAMIYLAL